MRIKRRQVVEENLVLRRVGMLEVDRFDLYQREVSLPVFRRPDLARDCIACA